MICQDGVSSTPKPLAKRVSRAFSKSWHLMSKRKWASLEILILVHIFDFHLQSRLRCPHKLLFSKSARFFLILYQPFIASNAVFRWRGNGNYNACFADFQFPKRWMIPSCAISVFYVSITSPFRVESFTFLCYAAAINSIKAFLSFCPLIYRNHPQLPHSVRK